MVGVTTENCPKLGSMPRYDDPAISDFDR